jgi:hypothetical protein
MSQIYSRPRAKQLIDYNGLEWGRCRPTDIDMSIDFKGELFIFVEAKLGDALLTMGQRLHLQGLVDGLRAGGKEAYAVFAVHDKADPEDDVIAADMAVKMVYDGSDWEPFPPVSLKKWMDITKLAHDIKREAA